MRNSLTPNIMEDRIEFYMHGGLQYNHTGCPLAPPSTDFMDDFEDFSQILITEDAATCWVN